MVQDKELSLLMRLQVSIAGCALYRVETQTFIRLLTHNPLSIFKGDLVSSKLHGHILTASLQPHTVCGED